MNNKITVFYDHILGAARQRGCTTAEIASEITSCGITGVEMDYYTLRESGDGLADELLRLGLPINSCYCFFDWAARPDDDSYISVLNDLTRLNIGNLLVVPGFIDKSLLKLSNAKEDSSEDLSDTASSVSGLSEPAYSSDIICSALNQARTAMLPNMIHLLEEAEKRGIKVALEDFDDITAPFATISQVKWFLDRLPSLGLAFDTGNFLYSEEDVIKAYEQLHERITYVHCKDRSFTPVEGEESKATVKNRQMYSSAVGKGVIPMSEIIEKLKKDSYTGPIAIEHFGSLDQLGDMKTSASFLRYFS